MTTRSTRFALVLGLALAVSPFGAGAQTLPQSTVDRQSISQLQYQMSLPGVTAPQRLQMQEQISQLQYQINTRPLISAPPGTSTNGTTSTGPTYVPGRSSSFSTTAAGAYDEKPYVPISPNKYGYGSCDSDRRMIEYLTARLKDPSISQQERTYIPSQIQTIKADMKERKC